MGDTPCIDSFVHYAFVPRDCGIIVHKCTIHWNRCGFRMFYNVTSPVPAAFQWSGNDGRTQSRSRLYLNANAPDPVVLWHNILSFIHMILIIDVARPLVLHGGLLSMHEVWAGIPTFWKVPIKTNRCPQAGVEDARPRVHNAWVGRRLKTPI